MNSRICAAIVVMLWALSVTAQNPELPAGKIVERVVCDQDAAFSYALYLPSSYDPSRKWPILYCFDARRHGKVPVELFLEGAEKFGYIVAGSNESSSDDPTAPNLQAMQAMWVDTRHRFSIDEQRSYATGFSGGARIACDMGYRYPDAVAGVIGCGAGFPTDRKPSADTPFAYFGTVGKRDFNFYEMRALETQLRESGMAHQVRSFDGDHSWPPATLCTEALEWMEVQAMKAGLRPKDTALLQQVMDRRIADAGALETAGKWYEAVVSYGNVVSDFDGLFDVAQWKEKTATLRGMDVFRREEETWNRRDREAREFMMKLASVIRSIRTGSRIPEIATVKAFLDIDTWKRKAANATDAEESLHARRLLSSVMVQTTFYLPRTFQEYGDFPRAVMVLTLATDISPDAGWAWYNLACSHALAGDTKKALDALGKCVDTGFDDITTMESDTDLRSLREEKAYRKLEDRVRKKAAAAKKASQK